MLGEYNQPRTAVKLFSPSLSSVTISPTDVEPIYDPKTVRFSPDTKSLRTSGQLRETALHEFGHLLTFRNDPKMLERFLAAGGKGSKTIDNGEAPEAFAELLTEAAHEFIPNLQAREEGYAYKSTALYKTPERMAFLRRFVQERLASMSLPTDRRTPTQIRDTVVADAARKRGVPVQLALAVSRVENARGDPLARGKAGEIGLMQVHPLAHNLDPKQLEDPAFNADYGTRLLRGLFENYGSWEKALRAYNGALGNPEAGDAYVNRVRAAMKSQLGAAPSTPISSADREFRDRLALARRVISDSRFSPSERAQTLQRFHAVEKR